MTLTAFDFDGIDADHCSLCGHDWDSHDTLDDKCFVACEDCRWLQSLPLTALPKDWAWRIFEEGH